MCRWKEMCIVCVRPRVEGRDMYSSLSPALFFRLNNFSHPDMHSTLSRQDLHCCNHMYVSCDGFHYSKNISANHQVQDVLLGRVAGKRVSDPSSRDHRDVVEPFPMHFVPQDSHPKVGEGHSFTECLICWRRRSQCL